ncbi:MAG TPA: GWxTD domain-containing protein, partial [Bacteroidales bacterium]|nr:GWxTD domain-containing protein [Bacteroidales bacterium]
NYLLVTEVRNSRNEKVAGNEVFFQRINPNVQLSLEDIRVLDVRSSFVEEISRTDTLAAYIRTLLPISTEMERVFAEKHLASADLALMQQYFLNFWLERNELNPRAAWLEYRASVAHVDQHFSTPIKKGYETDRGMVYLKYGPPNTIAESHHEPSAYPYEIWHYYQLKNQTNKKFVFCSRDNVTNDFELIHSDAIGEVNNYRWQLEVMRRTTDGFDLDQKGTERHWGGKIDTYYQDPR